jgi:hypothetical protein
LAIFAATASKLQTETDNIWKFQRYLLVIDFAHRLPLPAPFSILHYIYFIYRYFNHCFCKCSPCCDKKVSFSFSTFSKNNNKKINKKKFNT